MYLFVYIIYVTIVLTKHNPLYTIYLLPFWYFFISSPVLGQVSMNTNNKGVISNIRYPASPKGPNVPEIFKAYLCNTHTDIGKSQRFLHLIQIFSNIDSLKEYEVVPINDMMVNKIQIIF